MRASLISLIAGMVFAVGLTISGMINPAKVKGFLDIFGNWDYSLAFVMGGAVGLNLMTFKYFSSKKPFLSDNHFLPHSTDIDKKLVVGSALFWCWVGTCGYLPGPGTCKPYNS